ncbi:NADH dehydrogenase [ubiquinone] 1 alpha subcomplex assembly factor 7 [Nitrospirillum amazonense]|uniref:NADH dehydrogenase [ubiquinone] 1 alpha subcomplex assembly factor 7 n=1 Tax=Nitrospirillum amazonense TaxID=28077 RepID=A0A560F0D2_9PROT|nr:SAM-dependent methyltransferase [Nitrospirillum amazonense]TWB15082.1 NADH dehydrogenase [ubiquinone] 1 alpha subcomplex assembly factor 7 [Nitrospirillum amazonense]
MPGTPPPLGTLAGHLIRRIRDEGPLRLSTFMAEALGHPTLGYYTTRDPLGAAGDFTTAPEISQMFGELLGLWCAQAWLALGSPAPLHLVELGPGRGTLMADALRAMARVPGLTQALRVHMVETSPSLRARQRATLAALPAAAQPPHPIAWADSLAVVPEGPLLVLANEFFDALPIRQMQKTARGWAERCVTWLEPESRFAWTLDAGGGAALLVPPDLRDAPEGAVVELCPAALTVAGEIGRRLATHPGAALVVDYGYDARPLGDTLQAVRGHAYAVVLDDPGQADLTAHVDFRTLAATAVAAGARSHGIVEQGALLHRLGIQQRAAALKRGAAAPQAHAIDLALDRLAAPDQMGRLFKALALTSPGAPPPAGFEPSEG